MSKHQWQQDIERDWPRLVAFMQSFSLAAWVSFLAVVLIIIWAASQWFVVLLFALGGLVGWQARGVYEKQREEKQQGQADAKENSANAKPTSG